MGLIKFFGYLLLFMFYMMISFSYQVSGKAAFGIIGQVIFYGFIYIKLIHPMFKKKRIK